MDDLLLTPKTADEVWTRSYELLNSGKFSAKQLITKSHVEVVCTTDDPIDDLSHHHAIAEDSSFSCRVLPTWRPDKAMAVECPEDWNAYIEKLENASQLDITHFSDFIQALENRHDYFHSMGCRISDHGIEKCYGRDFTENQLAQIFEKLKKKEALHEIEIDTFKSGMMYHFARMDHEKSWTQQIHYGALRNNNSLMYNKLGPDVGFDSIASTNTISEMARMLDHQNRDGCLPKTIIYNLNPSDNECVATMLGNFQDGNIAGKMQMGSGWWFLDQKDGMERQIESLSQLGLLSRFVGMLTDSRSFLSYTRHEYFRRILCNILGNDIKKGLIPEDMELVGQMVSNICSHNAKSYFAFDA
jgi:glucuronate isomerase